MQWNTKKRKDKQTKCTSRLNSKKLEKCKITKQGKVKDKKITMKYIKNKRKIVKRQMTSVFNLFYKQNDFNLEVLFPLIEDRNKKGNEKKMKIEYI